MPNPSTESIIAHGGQIRPQSPPIGSFSIASRIAQQIQAVRHGSRNRNDLFRNLGRYLSTTAGCNALWLVVREGQGQWSTPQSVFESESGDPLQGLSAHVVKVVDQSATAESIGRSDSELPGQCLIAFPASNDESECEMFCGLFPSAQPGGLRLEWVLTLIAAEIDLWHCHEQVRSTVMHAKSLSDFVNFSAELNRSGDRIKSSLLIVNELRKLTEAQHVGLVLRSGLRNRYRLVAVSDVESFDQESEISQIVQSAAIPVTRSGELFFWSGDAEIQGAVEPRSQEAFVARQYCEEFDCEGCVSLPLIFSDGRVIGSVVIGLSNDQLRNQGYVKYVRRLARLIGGHLEVVIKSQRSALRVCADQVAHFSRKQIARTVGIAGLLTALAMLIPWPYHVGCGCKVELVKRRFVAAPYDGTLETTLVQNGDVVQQNQILARMDGRQLRMEIAGLQAELQSQKKQRDSALARGDVAKSQIARAEMERLSAEIDIMADRLENLEVKSPISGVVVSGDLDKVQGARLEMGQTLFEVGPLDHLLVEVNIPETEIQYVSSEMKVRLALDAYPHQTFVGKIQRIHPHTEIVDNDSFFVAEVRIENEQGYLRPGMKGRAKIVGARHALGWNLFHRAWERARIWLIW